VERQWTLPPLDVCQAKAKDYHDSVAPTQFSMQLLARAEKSIKMQRWTDINLYVSSPQVQINESDNSGYRGNVYAGFNWSIPLYDGGEINFQLKQLEQERRRLSLQHEKGLNELRRQVDLLHRRGQLLVPKIAAQKSLLALFEKKRALTLANQKLGIGSDLETLKAQLALEEQGNKLALWRMEQNLISFKLQMLMGDMK
jgi:outer membrane protein TolC